MIYLKSLKLRKGSSLIRSVVDIIMKTRQNNECDTRLSLYLFHIRTIKLHSDSPGYICLSDCRFVRSQHRKLNIRYFCTAILASFCQTPSSRERLK